MRGRSAPILSAATRPLPLVISLFLTAVWRGEHSDFIGGSFEKCCRFGSMLASQLKVCWLADRRGVASVALFRGSAAVWSCGKTTSSLARYLLNGPAVFGPYLRVVRRGLRSFTSSSSCSHLPVLRCRPVCRLRIS